MKKIATLSIIFFGAIFLAGCGQQPSDQPKEKNSANNVEEEAFKATLKVAVEKGVPIKCTEPENPAGTQLTEGYIKGHKYYGELKHKGVQESRILIVDNCLWGWNKGDTKGWKRCAKTTDEIWEEILEEDNSEEEIWNCMPSVFTDAKFTPPSDIEFALDDGDE